MKKNKQKLLLLVFAFLAVFALVGSAWAAISLPTATLSGSVQTTVTDLTFTIDITRVNYADGVSFAVGNGTDESVIYAEVAISGATRTGPYTFTNASLEIRNPSDSFQYLTADLNDIVFVDLFPGDPVLGGLYFYLNLGLDASNPSTLNLSNVVLSTDVTHPSRFIDELVTELSGNNILGLKLGFSVTGDITGTGTGSIFDGLLDGVVAAAPNNPPVADAGLTTSSVTCLATSCDVNLDGSQSSDIDSTIGTNDDIVLFEWFIDANNDGTLDPSELLATGETATVNLPLGMHDITLRVTDSQNATSTDTITVVIDPAELSFIQIDKVHVKKDGKVKIRGRLALPAGVSHLGVNSVGSATIGISTLGNVINESVDFVEDSNGNKWKYNASPVFGVKKFRIDWTGSKFNYQNGPLSIKTDHIGDNETELEIVSCVPVTVDIAGTIITIDANDVVSSSNATVKIDGDDDGDSDGDDSDGGNSADDDDDCSVNITLPFALTPDMVINVSGSVTDSFDVGQYFTAAVGKFKLYGRFDATGVVFSSLVPMLNLTVTLGDEGFSGALLIDQATWTKIKPKYWKYKASH